MPRNFPDLIPAYLEYAAVTEAPKRMHFWSAVSMIAGALRRRVWIDMKRFQWTPSFYIVFVAPPGIVAKSTTIDISMDLLRQIPGIKFGPNSVTWQALVESFQAAGEAFEYQGAWHPMAPLTLAASELGSLLNLQDRDMINLLIEMWDGKKHYEKITKMSGNNSIECPWINLQAATTPHWIADNMPQGMVGGGLSSRCIFIWAQEKERYVAYVDEQVNAAKDDLQRRLLIEDLEAVSLMAGPFEISEAARAWGRDWYERFWRDAPSRMDDQMLEGYAARKQTHMHKTAMILSASRGDSRIISCDDLQLANTMLEDLEADMRHVFARIGKGEDSIQADRFIDYVRKHSPIAYTEAYRAVHTYFPKMHDFEGILHGAINSGQLRIIAGPPVMLAAVEQAKVIPITPETKVG